MKRTRIDFLVTNVINIGLFVGIFAFGYWRWQLLQDVIIESVNSQEQYKTIHGAMKSTSQLDHLGESVYEWTPSDSTAYQRKLAESLIRIESLGDLYAKTKIDSVKNALMLKGHLLSEIYSTTQKRNANDEHLREDRAVTVKDTETYVKHYTGHIFQSSREEVSSRSRNRTVTVPSINEMAFIDKELCNINLNILNDSLVDVNKWLDINMSQILDEDDDKAEKKASDMLEKASNIGRHTFMGGMAFLFFIFGVNYWNSKRRKKVMKALEDESAKLENETRKLERESKMRQQESMKLAEESMKLSIEVEKNRRMVDGRSKMMYSIVHDLRTPLSIIIGYNDMEFKSPTKNEKYIKAIEFSAKQLRSMIDQLLDYFRLESNKGVLKPRDFSMIELSNNLTKAFECVADEKRIEFIKPEPARIVLHGDYEKICHVAMNLLDNAFKFTRQGTVTLGLSYTSNSLDITVRDTGIGIRPEDQERVFSSFTRFPNAVATGKEGFGIGLSTVKMLVDLMGGKITFKSSDEGTAFHVCIPMEVAKVKDEPLATEVVKASDKKKRVLAVDDSNVWLLMIQEIMEQNGFECDICDDTDKFFTMLRGGNYSLVMLDLQMPKKSGRELLDLMRKSKVGNSQTVPVIVSTSSGVEMREELINAGFDEFIPKTADVDAMIRVVNEVIAKSTKTITPDFTRLRKSVAGFLIDETEDAVDGLHDAIDNMDFDEMNKLAHSLKSSWVPYRIGVLVDPVMEIAKQRNMGAANRLATYMAEIDKMAEIVIAKCKEIQGGKE